MGPFGRDSREPPEDTPARPAGRTEARPDELPLGDVVADMDLGLPQEYKDVFRILANNNIISEPLGKKLESMTGMRNILVHDYLRVDALCRCHSVVVLWSGCVGAGGRAGRH